MEPDAPVQPCRFTFGHYRQTDDWRDVRTLTWPEMVAALTTHSVGPKAGTCIVPATFSGTRRRKDEAVQIDVAMLDSDSGATLDEITAAIRAKGWTAIVASTHSHLSSATSCKLSDWEKHLAQHGPHTTAEHYLIHAKGMLASIAAGARLEATTADQALFTHRSCPRFRVVVPLLRPWRAADYATPRLAGSAWKGRVEALAAALGLAHDQSCTDTSRLFYLPRRPADGPPPETEVLEGSVCDIFTLPEPEDSPPSGPARAKPRKRGDAITFTDPETGEEFDTRSWARRLGERFLIVKALGARRSDALTGHVAEGGRHHIRCPNEAEHSQSGIDTATFAMDAGGGAEAKGFVVHCRHAHCDGRDRLFFLRRMLEQGWLAVADLTNPEFLAGDQPVLPVIRIVGGQIATVVDQAEAALIQAKLDLYQRGPMIVRPGRVLVAISDGREVSGLRSIELGQHALAEVMTQAATWEKYDARRATWVEIDAPTRVAVTYLQRKGQWLLPVLTGIINAPTLRSDGSLLDMPGYDTISGLLLCPDGASFPTIRKAPQRAHALKALEALKAVLASFPFVDDASRSVALSAILTACIRRSLRTAPMHAFTAPAAGSGKSKLVDIASMVAVGREAGVISPGKNEEECEKRLGALLLASEGVIAIDNCEAPLGGEFLCAMLTQPVVRARVLGKSEAPELPSNALITATGNNLQLVGDITRRAIVCRLDAKVERPELRSFDFEPVALAKQERGRLVVAALTMLLAYHQAGRPDRPGALGSFEEWSDWVRGTLIWLGEADPVETMEAARDSDPRLDELKAVLTEWSTIIGPRQVMVREIIECATQQIAGHMSMSGARSEFVHPDFREALLAVAGAGGAINGKSLGRWLAAHEGRINGNLRIMRGTLRHGTAQWVVKDSAPNSLAA
jgi:hypothetical protein